MTTYVVINAEGDAIQSDLTEEEAGHLILKLRDVAYSIELHGRGWLLRVNGTPVYGSPPGCSRSEAKAILLRRVARNARIADGWPAEAEIIRDRAPAP